MSRTLTTVHPKIETPRTAADIIFAPLESNGTVGWGEIFRTAIDSLMSNRVRSFLTMLGVIIGVASVVALMALGDGASASITGSIQAIGTNSLTVINGAPNTLRPGASGSVAQNLSLDDVNALQALNLPVNGIAPQLSSSQTLVAPAADQAVTLVGTTANYAALNSLTLSAGTFFDDAQNKSAAAVVVLGNTVAADLFGEGSALGQIVRVNGQPLRVIGVLDAKGGGGFGSPDDQAFVPLNYAYQHFANTRTPDGNHLRVSIITISVTYANDIDAVQERVKTTLRAQHNLANDGSKDDFNVLNQASFLNTLNTITSLLTAFLAAVAGISLLVGGIGIMNIMLVSVTERTREIGLRKAVGARGQDILMQFLVEAVVLSLTGGLIGLALGVGIAGIVTLTGALQASVSLTAMALAISFALAVGIFFGIYPARRAAQLNPIDALRYE
jgi:putative ABC transport system permease protein